MTQRALIIIGQFILINLLYLFLNVVSLGLLIIPTTSALFHFIDQERNDKQDPNDLIPSYFRFLKQSMKRTMGMQVTMYVLFWMMFFNLENITMLTYPFFIKQTIVFFYIWLWIEFGLMIIYVSYLDGNHPYVAIKPLVSMSFYLIHKHLVASIIIIVGIFISWYVLVAFSWVLGFIGLFSFGGLLIDELLRPISRKYIKEKRESNDE